jgi:hypothetical protein
MTFAAGFVVGVWTGTILLGGLLLLLHSREPNR